MYKQDIQTYHVTVRDLQDDTIQGFLLTPSAKTGSSFMYNTLAPVGNKQLSGETTMGDLTNTEVFVQYNRDGFYDGSTFIGPRWVKYWTPRMNYSNIFPTGTYRHGFGMDAFHQKGELRIAHGVIDYPTLPNSEQISSYEIDYEGNDIFVYAGSRTSGKVYVSDDKWLTWSLLVDLQAETGVNYGQIRQLLIVKDKKVKKLMILAGVIGTWYGGSTANPWHLFSYNLGDYYGFDLVKHTSGFYVDSKSKEDDRYPSCPDAIQLSTIPSGSIAYTSIQDTLDNELVKITLPEGISGWYHVISYFTEEQIKKIQQVKSIGIQDTAGTISKVDIYFINETTLPTTYTTPNNLTIAVPKFSIVVEQFTSVDYTKKYRCVLFNRVNATITNVRPGMVLSAVSYGKVYATVSTAGCFFVNQHIQNSELSHSWGNFTFNANSYQRVFDIVGTPSGMQNKSLLGVSYKKGGVEFAITEEYGSRDITIGGSTYSAIINERQIMNIDNENYFVPEKLTNNPINIVADVNIGASNGTATIQNLQRIGSPTESHSIVQIMKLGYDQTSGDPEEYIGAIVYYPNDKYQFHFIPLQVLALKDTRLWDKKTDVYTNATSNYTYNESGYYYTKMTYRLQGLLEKKYSTQGFDEDIPTPFVTKVFPGEWYVPVQVAYQENKDTSYFTTFKRVGWDTITIRASTLTGVKKVQDVPGVWYATGICYANTKLYFLSKNYGKVYQCIMTENTIDVDYEEIYMEGKYNPVTGNEESELIYGVVFEWDYLAISNNDGVAYSYNTITTRFREKFGIEEINQNANALPVNMMIPLGDRLIIQDSSGNVWKYWQDVKADKWYIISSIYGAFVGTINKIRIQARVLVNNQANVGNKWQKVRLAISYDNGITFEYLPRVLWLDTIADNFYGAVAPEYEFTYDEFGGNEVNECYFRFPYEALSKKLCYKLELFRGTCELHEFYGAHVEFHYIMQSFKELMLTMNFDLRPKRQLLDGSIEHSPDAHRQKFNFLKKIWEDWRKVEITLPRWEKYFAVPFAQPNTWTDGFALVGMDLEEWKKDLDNFGYTLSMQFKTIKEL